MRSAPDRVQGCRATQTPEVAPASHCSAKASRGAMSPAPAAPSPPLPGASVPRDNATARASREPVHTRSHANRSPEEHLPCSAPSNAAQTPKQPRWQQAHPGTRRTLKKPRRPLGVDAERAGRCAVSRTTVPSSVPYMSMSANSGGLACAQHPRFHRVVPSRAAALGVLALVKAHARHVFGRRHEAVEVPSGQRGFWSTQRPLCICWVPRAAVLVGSGDGRVNQATGDIQRRARAGDTGDISQL